MSLPMLAHRRLSSDTRSRAFRLNHGSPPSIEGDLPNVVFLSKFSYELLNESIVHDVAFRGLDEALPLPDVIWNVVSLYS